MPDLSKRPERYATALVALTVVGAFTYRTLDIRFGPDHRIAQLQSENSQLAQQLSQHASPSAAPTSSATSITVSNSSHKDCSAFPNQQAAQQFWNAHRTTYPSWDGNHNGVVCEQLKSNAHPSGKPRPTVTVSTNATAYVTPAAATVVAQNSQAASQEPSAPSTAPPIPSGPTKPTAPSKATILASRQHFGLYAGTQEEYNNVESTLARDTTMHGYFQGFDSDFRAEAVNSAWAAGEIPFLTWESRPLNDAVTSTDYSLPNIVAGGFDTYLKAYADDIVANGLPLVIRFDQEMNGNWYRWAESNATFNNPKGSFIAAWRHVHDIFQAEGANNLVVWDWAPNRIDNIRRYASIDNYYPGDDYVDWVGMTGYYRPGDSSPTFASTYNATLAELRRVAPSKPILIAEAGATESGGHKLAWVSTFFSGLQANPDVIGFVWFNYAVTASGTTNDWRIQSSSDVTKAFRTGLYATGFGRDHGKKPILVTTVPSASPTTTSSASPSTTGGASPSSTGGASPSSTRGASPTTSNHVAPAAVLTSFTTAQSVPVPSARPSATPSSRG
ncbi:hypothetical protein M6D93_09765 [Jatrophihabitans telluris]|uniref:GH26 domain-containing protein n=1 Tax=Jatrophihabitans telluris TaxID=2038343 RepID=A0ABY4R5K2_9ACTN|nr:glycosyl hydrolase [Jatrophihabitans telluris]UQX90267.1 hypothetical protein M6D93_09765 [Jatrophihabitans telluris]